MTRRRGFMEVPKAAHDEMKEYCRATGRTQFTFVGGALLSFLAMSASEQDKWVRQCVESEAEKGSGR